LVSTPARRHLLRRALDIQDLPKRPFGRRRHLLRDCVRDRSYALHLDDDYDERRRRTTTNYEDEASPSAMMTNDDDERRRTTTDDDERRHLSYHIWLYIPTTMT
jgi:hypothetical protein